MTVAVELRRIRCDLFTICTFAGAWGSVGCQSAPHLTVHVDQALLTFQNTGEEPLTIPEMLLRQALGVNHWPVGM